MLGGNSRNRRHKRHVLGVAAGACAALTVLGLTAVPAVADQEDIPDFRPEQWALESIGAQEAWESTQGQGITVALLGVDIDENHPDLRDNVEVDTEFGGNGNDTEQGTAAGALVAGHGHGMDADGGVLGVVPLAKLLVLPGGDDLAGAIEYAVDAGAQVVLLPEEVADDEDQLEATASAARSGTVVVAPAGGEEDLNVLAVGGTDEDGELVPDSPEASSIDLLAPGADLYTAGEDQGQIQVTGTPYAAAVAAGAAAILSAEYPQLNPEQIRSALLQGSQQGAEGLPSLHLPSAVAQSSGEAQDIPLIDEDLVEEDSPAVPVWIWFALVGVVLVIIVLVLVLWVRRTTKDPYGVAAERREEEEQLAAERAEQAKAEERPSRRKKGGRRRKK
ncbi:S8 family serine peptidase [Nocardiopsis exhalans]|uniref:S8 family serine peptidase n=1 Tax=Nocardiopsis exhalans TaxID=163604 RepID=A0ABY5D8K4_9ACTN|nr:S8 family serine peptidase [Nocardiopsis exhalans]USY19568.1 S8 family serine peptidase [Nocardiopsis exhalans]